MLRQEPLCPAQRNNTLLLHQWFAMSFLNQGRMDTQPGIRGTVVFSVHHVHSKCIGNQLLIQRVVLLVPVLVQGPVRSKARQLCAAGNTIFQERWKP